MNELTNTSNHELSSDINTITAEINAYQRVAGEAIFEIGRRLKHVKESDLAHGEYERWVQDEAQMSPGQARKFVKVYERFSKRSPGNGLPNSITVLYELTSFTDEQLEQEYELPDGTRKKPVDMSRRQIEELKRQIKKDEEEEKVHRNLSERLAEEKEQDEQDAQAARDNLEKAKIEAEAMAKEPYGVKLGLAMYEAIEKLSEWQKEYSWIITDETEFRKLIEADPNIARMFNRVDKFWQQMSEVFHTTRNKGTYSDSEEVEVIDAEYSEII